MSLYITCRWHKPACCIQMYAVCSSILVGILRKDTFFKWFESFECQSILISGEGHSALKSDLCKAMQCVKHKMLCLLALINQANMVCRHKVNKGKATGQAGDQNWHIMAMIMQSLCIVHWQKKHKLETHGPSVAPKRHDLETFDQIDCQFKTSCDFLPRDCGALS